MLTMLITKYKTYIAHLFTIARSSPMITMTWLKNDKKLIFSCLQKKTKKRKNISLFFYNYYTKIAFQNLYMYIYIYYKILII